MFDWIGKKAAKDSANAEKKAEEDNFDDLGDLPSLDKGPVLLHQTTQQEAHELVEDLEDEGVVTLSRFLPSTVLHHLFEDEETAARGFGPRSHRCAGALVMLDVSGFTQMCEQTGAAGGPGPGGVPRGAAAAAASSGRRRRRPAAFGAARRHTPPPLAEVEGANDITRAAAAMALHRVHNRDEVRRVGAEIVHEKLYEIYDPMIELVQECHGDVIRIIGDMIMCIFHACDCDKCAEHEEQAAAAAAAAAGRRRRRSRSRSTPRASREPSRASSPSRGGGGGGGAEPGEQQQGRRGGGGALRRLSDLDFLKRLRPGGGGGGADGEEGGAEPYPAPLLRATHQALECSFRCLDLIHLLSRELDLHVGVAVGETEVLYVGGHSASFQYLFRGKVINAAADLLDASSRGEVSVPRALAEAVLAAGFPWQVLKEVEGGGVCLQRAPAAGAAAAGETPSPVNPGPTLQRKRSSQEMARDVVRHELQDHPYRLPIKQRGELLAEVGRGGHHHNVREAIWSLTPLPVRSAVKSEAVGLLSEIRDACILFAMLALPPRREEEEGEGGEELGLAEVQRYFLGLQELVIRFRGIIEQFSVDDKGTILVAGFGLSPFIGKKPREQACLCGIQLVQWMQQQGGEAHVGIASGPVIWASLGNELRREFAFMSDTVNLAARLMCAAKSQARARKAEEEAAAAGRAAEGGGPPPPAPSSAPGGAEEGAAAAGAAAPPRDTILTGKKEYIVIRNRNDPRVAYEVMSKFNRARFSSEHKLRPFREQALAGGERAFNFNVLADHATMIQAEAARAVVFLPLRPIKVKGKAAPVEVYVPGQRGDARPPERIRMMARQSTLHGHALVLQDSLGAFYRDQEKISDSVFNILVPMALGAREIEEQAADIIKARTLLMPNHIQPFFHDLAPLKLGQIHYNIWWLNSYDLRSLNQLGSFVPKAVDEEVSYRQSLLAPETEWVLRVACLLGGQGGAALLSHILFTVAPFNVYWVDELRRHYGAVSPSGARRSPAALARQLRDASVSPMPRAAAAAAAMPPIREARGGSVSSGGSEGGAEDGPEALQHDSYYATFGNPSPLPPREGRGASASPTGTDHSTFVVEESVSPPPPPAFFPAGTARGGGGEGGEGGDPAAAAARGAGRSPTGGVSPAGGAGQEGPLHQKLLDFLSRGGKNSNQPAGQGPESKIAPRKKRQTLQLDNSLTRSGNERHHVLKRDLGDLSEEERAELAHMSEKHVGKQLQLLERAGFVEFGLDEEFGKAHGHSNTYRVTDLLAADAVINQVSKTQRCLIHEAAAEWLYKNNTKEKGNLRDLMQVLPFLLHHYVEAEQEEVALIKAMAFRWIDVDGTFFDNVIMREVEHYLPLEGTPHADAGVIHNSKSGMADLQLRARALEASYAIPWLRGVLVVMQAMKEKGAVCSFALKMRHRYAVAIQRRVRDRQSLRLQQQQRRPGGEATAANENKGPPDKRKNSLLSVLGNGNKQQEDSCRDDGSTKKKEERSPRRGELYQQKNQTSDFESMDFSKGGSRGKGGGLGGTAMLLAGFWHTKILRRQEKGGARALAVLEDRGGGGGAGPRQQQRPTSATGFRSRESSQASGDYCKKYVPTGGVNRQRRGSLDPLDGHGAIDFDDLMEGSDAEDVGGLHTKSFMKRFAPNFGL